MFGGRYNEISVTIHVESFTEKYCQEIDEMHSKLQSKEQILLNNET